jgi:4-oxalocrotonate tautomerase
MKSPLYPHPGLKQNALHGRKLWFSPGTFAAAINHRKEIIMPLVDIHVIEGVFSAADKQQMISKVTDTMVAIEGENMRGVTWVRVHDVPSGQWGIGGNALTTADVKALQAGS